MSFFKNSAVYALDDDSYDAISLKLIKQKTRGIIADYHFNGECWDVKARNGAVYSGQLDSDANGIGEAIWYCEGQVIQKYYNCSVVLDAESFGIYDEAVEMAKKEQAEKQDAIFDNETDFMNEEDMQNNLVA